MYLCLHFSSLNICMFFVSIKMKLTYDEFSNCQFKLEVFYMFHIFEGCDFLGKKMTIR